MATTHTINPLDSHPMEAAHGNEHHASSTSHHDHQHHDHTTATDVPLSVSSAHGASTHSTATTSLSSTELAAGWLAAVHQAMTGAHGRQDIAGRSVLNIKRTCYYFRMMLALMGIHSPPYRAESYHFAPTPKCSCQCPRDHLSCLVCCCHPQRPCDCLRQRFYFTNLNHHQRLSRCDRYCWPTSCVLLVLLLLVGLLFGPALQLIGLNDYELINESPQFCEFPQATLDHYREILFNLTSLPQGIANATALWAFANRFYAQAALEHISRANSTAWPLPYAMSTQKIAQDQILATQTCTDKECKWGIDLWVNCVEITVPCPDPLAVEELAQNAATQQYDSQITPYNQTLNDILNQTSIASTDMRDQITNQLWILFNRIQWGVTLYVFYLGVRIFIGDPYHMAQPSIPAKCLSILGSATKPTWVLLFVVGWYISEIIMQYLVLPDVRFFWLTISANPCYLDRQFVVQFYALIQNVCDNTTFYHNQFHVAVANYQHYQQVDMSYWYGRLDLPVYSQYYYNNSDPNHIAFQPWTFANLGTTDPVSLAALVALLNKNPLLEYSYTATCDPSTLIPLVLGMPNEESVSWMNVLIQSGVLMALFLEPFIAHFLIALFEVVVPLSSFNGRVLVPMDSLMEVFDKSGDVHEAARSRITTFLRASYAFPLVFWFCGLFVLIVTQYQYINVTNWFA